MRHKLAHPAADEHKTELLDTLPQPWISDVLFHILDHLQILIDELLRLVNFPAQEIHDQRDKVEQGVVRVELGEVGSSSELWVAYKSLQVFPNQALENLVGMNFPEVLHGVEADCCQGQGSVENIMRLLAVCLTKS